MWSVLKREHEVRVSTHQGVPEAEAFLCGHYARYLLDAKRPVPMWAWLNVLAHGSGDDILAFATNGPRRRSLWNTNVWEQAVAFLGHEIMSQTTLRGCTLSELQRSTLVPLEFDLAGRDSQTDLSPAEFVRTVLRALAQHSTRRVL